MEVRAREKADSFWSAPMSENMPIFLGYPGVCQEFWSWAENIAASPNTGTLPLPNSSTAPCRWMIAVGHHSSEKGVGITLCVHVNLFRW